MSLLFLYTKNCTRGIINTIIAHINAKKLPVWQKRKGDEALTLVFLSFK